MWTFYETVDFDTLSVMFWLIALYLRHMATEILVNNGADYGFLLSGNMPLSEPAWIIEIIATDPCDISGKIHQMY